MDIWIEWVWVGFSRDEVEGFFRMRIIYIKGVEVLGGGIGIIWNNLF